MEDLQNMDADQINLLLDQNGLEIPYQSKTVDRTNKKMFSFNYHSNSDEYKNLGNLHREKRVVEYFPQDDKLEFSTKPQILGKQENGGRPYNYEVGGLSYSHRIPKNLIGDKLRQGRKIADNTNIALIMDKASVDGGSQLGAMSNASAFPKTTNQDFHCDEVFERAKYLGK